MGTDRDTGIRGAIVALLAVAAMLLVFAAVGLFENQLNDALGRMANVLGVTTGEISSIGELFGNIVGWGIILGVNILFLPGFIVPPWALAALAGLCVLTAGYLWLRLRARR